MSTVLAGVRWISEKSCEKLLKELDAKIDAGQKANQLRIGKDTKDRVYIECKTARDKLSDALQRRTDFMEETKNTTEGVERFSLAQIESKLDRFPLFGRTSRSVIVINAALRQAYDDATKKLRNMTDASIERAATSPRGPYNSMMEMDIFLSTDSEEAWQLRDKGRFKIIGNRLHDLGTTLKTFKDEMEGSGPFFSSSRKEGLKLEHEIAKAFGVVIRYILAAPFEFTIHEEKVKKLEDAVEVLKNSGKERYVPLQREMIEFSKTLNALTDEHLIHKEHFAAKLKEKEKAVAKIETRSLTHISIDSGELKDTDKVITQMSKKRSDERPGLGLVTVATGSSEKLDHRKGGYGKVYKMELSKERCVAKHEQVLGRALAVKVWETNDRSDHSNALANLRMVREVNSWSLASSDPRGRTDGGQYLAQLLGIWVDVSGGRPGLVSLWSDHNKLHEYVKTHATKSEDRALLAYQMAQGVNFLHTCDPPIVHGDLKAANVIIVDKEPRITDFGISRCEGDAEGLSTNPNYYTNDYRAPELQFQLQSLVLYPTTKSDVYAFGCLMLETLSGRRPYDGYGKDEREAWDKAKMDMTPLDAEMNTRMDDTFIFAFGGAQKKILENCFSFHAIHRFSMNEVVNALETMVKTGVY